MPVRRAYLDANVILAYVNNEDGRADVVQALLDQARRGERDVIMSVLSIAEVAYGALELDSGLTVEGEAAIDKLWEPASPITLIDVSQALMRGARSITRDAKMTGLQGLRSIDAVHLASAQMHNCDEILTYENAETRGRWQQLTGLPVEEPAVDQTQLDLGH